MTHSVLICWSNVEICFCLTSAIGNPGDKRSFNGNPVCPPRLTSRERLQFIRAAYHLWSRILLDSTPRELRISVIKYNEIYMLIDVAHIPFWPDGGPGQRNQWKLKGGPGTCWNISGFMI
jgi:hypothetical protein